MDRPHSTLRTMEIRYEQDVVRVRQAVLQIASLLGFESQDRTRIATAVSEIARNAFKYAGRGMVEVLVTRPPDAALMVRVVDQGPGIAALAEILGGTYVSQTGMGLGIVGAKRLMDTFTIRSSPETGTVVEMSRALPASARQPGSIDLKRIAEALESQVTTDPFEVIREQNRELLRALEDLRAHESALTHVNQELEETNSGVVALYRELDDKSQSLQRASEVKSRFLSHMSHEFRTPVYSILALCRMLLQRAGGELTGEQEKQVNFILKAAQNLEEMVNDLLDLAKVEAGQVTLKPKAVDVEEVFSALRGMMRPLLVSKPAIKLIFEKEPELPRLFTDEGKLSQILRNFISNAIKFTDEGSIRVGAELAGPRRIAFYVADTGIGIAAEDRERIFDEFAQVEGPHQQRYKGTGLGLPLSRKLAGLLQGDVTVESELGRGSTFKVVIATRLELPDSTGTASPPPAGGPEAPPTILVIDDDDITRYLMNDAFRGSEFRLLEAPDGPKGIELARKEHPSAIFLDLLMPEMDGFQVLDVLHADPETRGIPVIINSTRTIDAADQARLRGKAALVMAKNFSSRESASLRIKQALTYVLPGAKKGEIQHAGS